VGAAVLPGSNIVVQTLRLGTTIGTALIVLAVTARMLQIREFTEAFTMVTQRFRRRE
jgi:hypothetical protein